MSTSLNLNLPTGKKMAYCFTSFHSKWNPILKVSTTDLNPSQIYSSTNGNTIGSCLLISESSTFSCSASFNSPPSQILEPGIDDSKPAFESSCKIQTNGNGKSIKFLINKKY